MDAVNPHEPYIFPFIPEGPYEAYIFDCDGTLARSMDVHFAAWKKALRKHGASFEFTWEIFRAMAGMGLHQTVEALNERFGDKLDPEALVVDQEGFVDENIVNIQPMEEVVAMARKLAANYPVAVASGGHRGHVHLTLEAIGVADIFPVVVTQDDVKNGKPASDLFLLAAKKLGVDPGKCLVFEDAVLGFEAAKNAGMDYVVVRSD